MSSLSETAHRPPPLTDRELLDAHAAQHVVDEHRGAHVALALRAVVDVAEGVLPSEADIHNASVAAVRGLRPEWRSVAHRVALAQFTDEFQIFLLRSAAGVSHRGLGLDFAGLLQRYYARRLEVLSGAVALSAADQLRMERELNGRIWSEGL